MCHRIDQFPQLRTAHHIDDGISQALKKYWIMPSLLATGTIPKKIQIQLVL